MRRALDDKGYETIKSIGKGAFGEVVVARKSKLISISFRIFRKTVCCEDNFQNASQEEAIPSEIHRSINRNHEKTRTPQHS